MKIRILVILLTLAVLVSSITACATKGGHLARVMQLAPEDAEGVYYRDVKQMAEDPDFSILYDDFIIGLSYEITGIEASDISAFGSFEINWEDVFVLIGDFNLKNVRDALIEEYFIEGEHKGIEIWTDDYEDSIAFIDNVIVFGHKNSVEACIRIYKNEESSMYDNENMKAVADKLPASVISMVFGPDYLYSIEVLAGSACLRNLNSGDGIWDISGWLIFDSKVSAETAMAADIEDELALQLGAIDIEARLSDRFIEFKGGIEIPEY